MKRSCFNSQRDGILLQNIISSPRSYQVSIPNGMEFYQCRRGYELDKNLVSIPNGMEFYPENNQPRIAGISFQFPTGWNSTFLAWFRIEKANCFNSQRDGILPFINLTILPLSRRFNSQRDGILPKTYLSIRKVPICFNSQRDGILRLRARISHALQVVSIPNGMEFYSVPLLSDIWLIGFQFPTGWNSTIQSSFYK